MSRALALKTEPVALPETERSYSGYCNNVRVASVFPHADGGWAATGRVMNPWAPSHLRRYERFDTLAQAQSAAVRVMPPQPVEWREDTR